MVGWGWIQDGSRTRANARFFTVTGLLGTRLGTPDHFELAGVRLPQDRPRLARAKLSDVLPLHPHRQTDCAGTLRLEGASRRGTAAHSSVPTFSLHTMPARPQPQTDMPLQDTYVLELRAALPAALAKRAQSSTRLRSTACTAPAKAYRSQRRLSVPRLDADTRPRRWPPNGSARMAMNLQKPMS